MGTYVLDTHPLVWFLDGDPKLSKKADHILRDRESRLIIPTIVLAEIKYLFSRKRIRVSFERILEKAEGDERVKIHPFDVSCIDKLNPSLDLHDGIIVATAIIFRETFDPKTALVTKDRKITASGLIHTVW